MAVWYYERDMLLFIRIVFTVFPESMNEDYVK